MRILLISALLLTLSSCTLPFGKTDSSPTVSSETPQTATPIVEKVAASGNLVTLNYTLRDGSPEGKILETTRQNVAEENGIFATGVTYQPFQVMLGSSSVIPGFEKGLIGMKKGETKMIQVSPEEGYGTGARTQEIDKYQIAPVFTMKQPKKLFDEVITETVEKSKLNDSTKNAVVGQSLTGANGAVAKVTKVTDTDITFELQNVDNPFYKKELKVGATAENQGASFKITNITNDEVTLEVTNKQSPFYNKKFEVGESLTLPQGVITIVAIGDEKVTVAEMHPMAGKTLYFDVEVLDIQ